MSPAGIDYDRLAEEYARHRRVHPEVLRALCAGLGPASQVLEVGCGTGNYLIALHEATGCEGLGIDPSPEMLARARARSAAVRTRQGRAETLDVEKHAFDLVFSVDVIHHLDDPAAYMRQARRACRPGGRICTVTDSAWIIRHRQPLSTYFAETVELELARYPRIATLREQMAAAGFVGVQEQTVEHAYRLSDIAPYRERAFSALHAISDEAFARGIAQMERDLESGPIPCCSRYTLLWGHAADS